MLSNNTDNTDKKMQHINKKIARIDKKLNKRPSVILYEIFENYYEKRNRRLMDKKIDLKKQYAILEDDELKIELKRNW